MKYHSHFDYLSKGAIIRSRATWYEKGEKNNKYFLGLESHREKKGCIRKIFTSSGHLTSDPKRIMTEVEQFYSDLCSANAASSNVSYSFLHKPEIPNTPLKRKTFVRENCPLNSALTVFSHLKITSHQAMMGSPLNFIKLSGTM